LGFNDAWRGLNCGGVFAVGKTKIDAFLPLCHSVYTL
jgi:hypothetical protein